jgi:hypothetical protein
MESSMTQVSYDAAREFVTVFSPDGTAERVTRLNANDLIRTNGYMWRSDESPKETPAAPQPNLLETLADRAAIDAAEALSVAIAAEDEATEPSPIGIDLNKTSLHEIALEMTGNDDVANYLKAFSVDALRSMADQRYGEKIHHRTSLETAISKIMEFEAAKITSEAD